MTIRSWSAQEAELREEIEGVLETSNGLSGGLRWNVDRRNVRQILRHPETGPEGASVDPYAEAIIQRHARPSLLIRNDKIEVPKSRLWRRRLLPHKRDIERAIPSVGRIEFRNVPGIAYVGTGWLIEEDIVVTNRHVAEVFADRLADGDYAYVSVGDIVGSRGLDQTVQVRIDFREEADVRAEAEFMLGDILWIEMAGRSLPDIALIKLQHPIRDRAPLVPQTEWRRAEYIGVVGYPARDSRASRDAMDDVFGDIFDKKRFAPGKIVGSRDFVLDHDGSTLGGNSGSPVIDVDTGNVVGIHFGGREGVGNRAVAIDEVLKRLQELRVRVRVGRSFGDVIDTPDPETDDDEDIERRASEFSADALWERPGYQEDFLGDDASLRVPFPLPPSGNRDHLLVVRSGLSGQRRYLLPYLHFSVAMHKDRRLPIVTAVNIDGDLSRRLSRKKHKKSWGIDPRIERSQQIDNRLYKHNSLDRGHMVRRLDPAWGERLAEASLANKDTFFYTNCAPQHEDLNQGIWVDIEEHVLDQIDGDNVLASVFTGPVFDDNDLVYRGEQVPERFWKVVVFVDSAGMMRSGAFLLSQDHLLDEFEAMFDAFRVHQVPIREVADITGLDFGPLVEADRFGASEAALRHPVAKASDIRL